MTDEEWAELRPYAEKYADAKVAHDRALAHPPRDVSEGRQHALVFARLALEFREAAHALDMARHAQMTRGMPAAHLAQQSNADTDLSEVAGNA